MYGTLLNKYLLQWHKAIFISRISYEFNNYVWNVCVYKFSYRFVYVYCIASLAHVQSYSN